MQLKFSISYSHHSINQLNRVVTPYDYSLPTSTLNEMSLGVIIIVTSWRLKYTRLSLGKRKEGRGKKKDTELADG